MFCRDCGTECDERGLCPVCEQKARERAMQGNLREANITPVGKYRGLYGDLTISYYTIIIRRKWAKCTSKVTLTFEDVAEAAFKPATNTEYGFLSIRKKGSPNRPARTVEEALNSDMGLVFRKRQNRKFEKVSRFLAKYMKGGRQFNPNHSTRVYCPRCDSRNIRNYMTRFPVYMTLQNAYTCNTCGHSWYV